MQIKHILLLGLVWAFFGVTAPVWADRPPLSGKALTFQGFLVNANGVPYGTTEPEVFYMRFSITSSEGGGSLLWQSLPKQVEVREGLFSVRLGQFTADEQPIDESIFTGNDAGPARRHLMMEVSTGGTDGPWFGFFRKDLNPSLNDETKVESHIPIPAMPFTVSALRIQGPDIKEGSLRIVANPEDLSGTQPDLFLQTAQPLHGISIFQNENIGMVIINPATTASLHPMALKLMGKSSVQGGLYLDGNESSITIKGDLKNTAVEAGKLYLSQSTPDANSLPAIETGKIHAAAYESPVSRDYGINLTGTTTLRELIIQDTRRQGQSNLNIQSSNRAVIRIDNGDFTLSPSSILNVSSLNFGEQLIRMGAGSKGIEAMGFYDREQLSPSSSWPYQMIPHGLSIMNTLTLGGQYALDYSYLRILIGQTDVFGNTSRAGNALVPGTLDQPLHRHDLRAGSDPDALVDKLNEATDPRIIRRRISDEVAWLYEPNNFLHDNYFNFTDGLGTPGLLTAGGLTARFETLNTFLRSDFSGMYLGAKASGIKDFYFYECSDMNNCPHPAASVPYLDLRFNQANFSEHVTVEGMADILGDFYLNSTYDAPTFTNHLIYGINPALFTDTNPMMHAALGTINIAQSLVLNLAPVLNSRLDIGDILIADRLLDSRNPTQYHLDPNMTSRIFSLVVDQNVKVNQSLEGWFLNSVPRINVFDSAQFSGVVTASIFKDVVNPSVFFIDPDGSIDKTSLRRLTLTSDLYLEQQASVGGDFLSTADLNSQMDLIIQTGGFVSDRDIYLNRFRDSNNLAFFTDLNNQTILSSLENIGSVTGQSLDSYGSTNLLSMASNLQSQTLMGMGTMSAIRFVDLDDSLFYMDANSASRVQSMVVHVFSGADAIVRTSAYFLMPTTVSGNVTISQTLSLGADIIQSGSIMVTNASTIEFRVLGSGDIVAARRLELTSGFLASSPDAVFVIRDGLNQYSTTDSNYLSHSIFHNDVYFLQTSLALGSSREAVLTSEGRFITEGRVRSGSELRVGWNGLESSLFTSNAVLFLNSNQNSLVLSNEQSLNHLNLDARDIRVSRVLTGTNDLYTPIAYSDSSQFYLDPGSVSSIQSLTVSSRGSTGGYLILSAPLHFVRMQDRDNMTLALDPSAATTVTSLIFRSASLDSILTQSATQDETVFRIRDDAGNRIFELDNQLFWLGADGHMHTSGSLRSDGLALIKSDAGLIFSTATDSIYLTSQVLYLLAGKNGQYADSLHQHSEFYGIPLTSFMRRDINNLISGKQTLTASGLGLYLQPETVNSNLLFRQLNVASDTTLSMFADGQISASVLEGDGKLLTGISGTAIRINSISNEDLATNTIGSAKIADNAISGDRLKSFTLSETHMIPSTITSREIAMDAILSRHFISQSLLEPNFATGAIRGSHFEKAVIDNTLIAGNTLNDSRFVTQAVTEGHIQNDTITSAQLANDSIRIQHLTDNSINSSVIVSESLIDEDLAFASIGLSEIASLSINSYIVRDQNLIRSKIADSAIDSSRILSRTLLSETFEDQSITREKILSQTITSREIADLSLTNDNFQNQAITTSKIADSAIRSRHITDSAIETSQILNDSIRTRNFVLNTIGSSEILNLSLMNEDFIDDTLNPSHIQIESIEARHVRTKAVTAVKITPSGIDNRYFQPYTFQGDRIQNGAINQSHLQANSVLHHHIVSQTIQAQDVANSVVHGEKIQDLGILRTNLQTEGIGLHNVALDNILARHFVAGSLSSVHILTGSITTDRIADLSINSDKIIDLSLASDLFSDNSAIASKFAANSIGTVQVSDASLIISNFAQNLVTSGKIKDLSLETANFLELSIQGEDIANRQLIGSQVSSQAVTEIKIATQVFLSRHFSPLVLSQSDYALSTFVNSAFADGSIAGYNIETSEIAANVIENGSILRRSLSGTFVSTRTLAALTISSDAVIPFALTSRVIGDHQLVNSNFVPDSISRRALGTGSIEGDLITSFSVLAEKIASYSLDSLQFATDSVIHRTLKGGVVFTTNVLDGSILEQKIATDTLTRRVFAPSSIESSHIISQSIDAPAFVANAITQGRLENTQLLKERHLEQNTIQSAKISGTIAASAFQSQSLSGSVFQNQSIPQNRIVDFTIPGNALMDSSITTAQFANNTLGENHFVDKAIETVSIGDAQILNLHLSTGIIQSVHIKDGSLGQLQIMTRSLETTKFETGALHYDNIANGSILTTNIADMGISGDRFAAGSISYLKVSTHAIYGPELAPRSFNGTLLANDAINSTHIGPRFYLDASAIASSGIETSMLASDSIRPWHFPINSLTTAKLGSISASAFMSHSLGASKLAANAVTGTKIMTEVLGDKDRPIYYVGSDGRVRHTWERDPAATTWTVSGSQPGQDQGRLSINPASKTHLARFLNDSENSLQSVALSDGSTALIRKFPWPQARSGHSLLRLGANYYVIGGWDPTSTTCYSDVWRSSDGEDWEKIYNGGFFRDGGNGGFCLHGAAGAVINSTLILVGGCTTNQDAMGCNASNQINYSSDGITWQHTNLVADAPVHKVAYGSVANDGSRLLYFGGVRQGAVSNQMYVSDGTGLGWSVQVHNTPSSYADGFTMLFNQENLNMQSKNFAPTFSAMGGVTYADTRFPGDGSSELVISPGTYLQSNAHADWGFNFGHFTWEAWIKPSSITGSQRIFSIRQTAPTEEDFVVFGLQNANPVFYSNPLLLTTDLTVALGVWQHLAVTKSGSTIRVFLNGTKASFDLDLASNPMKNLTTQPFTIGAGSFGLQPYSGSIDSIRMIKTPLYISDFTHPNWLDGGVGGPQLPALMQPTLDFANGYFVVAGGADASLVATSAIWFASASDPLRWFRAARTLPSAFYGAASYVNANII
ncbi:MAG: LamG domain-containing protein [Candidatus Cloacimonetes bacterium]|nr:LamG domain-containing protein [Candidatus Cloacimonadota bacterium]